jgi:hypothetical protein
LIKQVLTTRIDEDTGEVLSERKNEYKSKIWQDGKGAMIKFRNYHKKLYSDIRLCDVIENKPDLFKTYFLVENIYKDTNIVYCRKSKTVFKPATEKDIANMFGITEKKTKEYLSRVSKLGVIAKITVDIDNVKYISYAFNPVFVNSCKYINNTLYLLFKPYVDNYCPEWIKQKYEEANRKYDDNLYIADDDEDYYE